MLFWIPVLDSFLDTEKTDWGFASVDIYLLCVVLCVWFYVRVPLFYFCVVAFLWACFVFSLLFCFVLYLWFVSEHTHCDRERNTYINTSDDENTNKQGGRWMQGERKGKRESQHNPCRRMHVDGCSGLIAYR